MSNSDLTPYQDELLEILVEECGEIVQEKSKIFRFGVASVSHHFNDGRTHLDCIEQELGDVLAMIELIKESGIGITDYGLEKAKQKKLAKLPRYMNNTKDSDVTAEPTVWTVDPLPTITVI